MMRLRYTFLILHTHTKQKQKQKQKQKNKTKNKNTKIRLIYIKEKYFPHHKFDYKILQIDMTINMIDITSINNLCDWWYIHL